WRTTDGANPWTAASMDFPGDPAGSLVQSIGIAPSDSNRIYVGTDYPDGKIWTTTTGLSSPPAWTDVSGPLKRWTVSAIAVDPTDPKVAYASVDTYRFDEPRLWKTTDGGATWKDSDGTAPTALPPAGGLSVAVNPVNPSMVYVGTATGIFESLDGGASWHIANENLATTGVEDLVFRRGTSELYAFTYGRGIYRVDVGNAAPPPNDGVATATQVQLNPDFKDRVSTRLATSEDTDPPVSCGAEGQQQTKSVWYRLTTPDGGNFEVSTDGSNYDTVVAVFTGGAGSFTPVACDDDAIGQGGDSLVKFSATPQTLYYIEVTRSSDASQEGLGGSLEFRVARSG
ncbi:MAG: large repetitive protein, partial [Actinomycetota bacterium]|nr:large repetitive protein [Actinomycetota bacterium]